VPTDVAGNKILILGSDNKCIDRFFGIITTGLITSIVTGAVTGVKKSFDKPALLPMCLL
jgi:hypothetical protein